MSAAIGRHRWPRALAFGGCLAACQPLPHPFAHDHPNADLLKAPDTASVTIAPIDGEPRATATALGKAVAQALLQREIAASDRTTSLHSYELSGTIKQSPAKKNGKAELTVNWRLRDPAGFTVARRSERLEAAAKQWSDGDDGIVRKLAEASAAQIAGAMIEAAPVETAPSGATRTRVAVRPVKGATGDGGTALANAITAVLKRQDVDIVTDAKAKADFYVEAEVTVAPPKAGKQNVKIVWHVRRPDGSEIGTVGQQNDVPTGLLNGPWGDVAYSVAMAAGEGIMALVDQGAPPQSKKS